MERIIPHQILNFPGNLHRKQNGYIETTDTIRSKVREERKVACFHHWLSPRQTCGTGRDWLGVTLERPARSSRFFRRRYWLFVRPLPLHFPCFPEPFQATDRPPVSFFFCQPFESHDTPDRNKRRQRLQRRRGIEKRSGGIQAKDSKAIARWLPAF